MEDLEALLEREESSQLEDESGARVDSGDLGVTENAPTDPEATEIRSGGGGGARIDESVVAGVPFTTSEELEPEEERDVEKSGEEGARDMYAGLAPFLFTSGVIALLLLLQPDMGTMAIIIGTAFVMYFLGGALSFGFSLKLR